jgi:hypothetical protein
MKGRTVSHIFEFVSEVLERAELFGAGGPDAG